MSPAALACLLAALVCLAAALGRRGDAGRSAARTALLSAPALRERLAALADERLRCESELDLLRGVFEVSTELIGCVDEAGFRERAAAALARYWRGARLELLVWERGTWRGGEGPPPSLAAPVALPSESGGDLVLDLSPAVEGQAALVLRQAEPQPSLSMLGADDQRMVAELLRGQFALSLRRVALYRRLQDLARSDALTGACRRWYGEARLAELVEGGAVVAVCLVDIDHFKRINDAHGHAAGDRVLAAVGRALLATVRGDDLVVRLGGEEFLVILPGTPPEGARSVAERLRAAIAALGGLPCPVTASVGLACCHRDDTAEQLVARADAALYQAKQAGRDRVMAADDPRSPLIRREPVPRSPGATTRAFAAVARPPR